MKRHDTRNHFLAGQSCGCDDGRGIDNVVNTLSQIRRTAVRLPHTPRSLLLGVAVLLSGQTICRAQNPAIVAEVRDSAGIEIVHNDLSDEAAWTLCQLATEPTLRIGAEEGDLMSELFQVEDALRLPDGSIVVVNRSTKEIRAFDHAGEFLWVAGRNGEGPGEFRDPIEVSLLPPDSLVVWDWNLHRISIFTLDGEFVRTIHTLPSLRRPTGHFDAIDSDAPFIIAFSDGRLPTGSQFEDQYLQLLRYGRDGVLVDTAATLPYGKVAFSTPPTRPMFEAKGSFGALGNVLATAVGMDPEISAIGPDLVVRRSIRWETPNREITSSDVRDRRRQIPSDRRRFRVEDSSIFPEVDKVRVDGSGNIWVRRFPRPSSTVNTWLGFDTDGAFRCALATPKDFLVMQFDTESVLGVTRDEWDTEYVELYRFALTIR